MPIDTVHHRMITGSYHRKQFSGCYHRRKPADQAAHSPQARACIARISSDVTGIRNATSSWQPVGSRSLSREKNAKYTFMQLLLLTSQLSPAEHIVAGSQLSRATELADPGLLPVQENGFLLAASGAQIFDPLRFPVASAQYRALSPEDAIHRQRPQDNIYIVNSEQVKERLFSHLKQSLLGSGWLKQNDAEDFELSLRVSAAGRPLLLSPLDRPVNGASRFRRFAQDERDARIASHISENCASEEEILNIKGENEGKVLIFEAQRAENPFRRFYDNSDETPSPAMRGITDGLNISADYLSLGVKYLVGKIVANAKRTTYYQQQGDDICAERFKRLIVAEAATSIDIGGVPFPSRKIRPVELSHAVPAKHTAAYYTRNTFNGIRREILLELKAGKGVIDDGGQKIFLKPGAKDNEFYTFHPDAVKPENLQRRVIVDEKTLQWRYADSFDVSDLNVQISEGKKQIFLHGEYFELHQNARREYQIVVPEKYGTVAYIPVYMEPLSKTWHMSLQNNRAVFSAKQKEIINKLSVEPDPEFHYIPVFTNNQEYYGRGEIYWQEKKGDHSHYPWGTFIEMDGKMLPVRNIDHAGAGELYEVYPHNIQHTKGYPVEFDGLRWKFERASSEHASTQLKKLVTPDYYAQGTDTRELSAPDSRGLRWNQNEQSYLKIENHYLKINKLNANRYAIPATKEHPRVILRFKKNKFFIETAQERLKNIVVTGMGGNKKHHPHDILKKLDGFNSGKATQLLDEYNFPENGFYSASNFALEIEQTGRVPGWAERFKKKQFSETRASRLYESVQVKNQGEPEKNISLKLGKVIGRGLTATVCLDASDNAYVIKKYEHHALYYFPQEQVATDEAINFRKFYGDEAATIYHDTDNHYYLRMYRVPGEPLTDLLPGSLPSDAKQRYVDMLEKLNNAGIMHGDLHSRNVLWDASSQKFNPIDISNIKSEYFSGQQGNAFHLNQVEEMRWQSMMHEIDRKTATTTTDS